MVELYPWHTAEACTESAPAHVTSLAELRATEGESMCCMAYSGDAVDQLEADLVVLSAEAVHTKKVDCNLLAEFCTAPGTSCILSRALLLQSPLIFTTFVSHLYHNHCIPLSNDHQPVRTPVSETKNQLPTCGVTRRTCCTMPKMEP